jgi:hypothetical protein
MKAIVQDRFGSPDVLQFVDVDPPEIGSDDVLVRVHAAAINPYDWHMLRGDPYGAGRSGAALSCANSTECCRSGGRALRQPYELDLMSGVPSPGIRSRSAGSPHQSPGMVIRPHHIRSYLSLAVANVADLGEAQSHAQHRRRSVNDMLTGQHHDSGRSEIRLKGHLDSRWAAWFDRMSLINERASSTRAMAQPSFADR